MEIECKYCSAKGFQSENKGTNKLPHFGILCCNKGKIKLTPFNPLPDKLYNYFTANDTDSKHFRTNIRGYNATLAMASLKINNRTVHTGAPGAFTVSGQMMRRIGPLIPYQKNNPVCIQTYFYDPQEQAKLRAKRLSSSKNKQDQERFEKIFFALHSIIIHAENKYLQAFLNLKEYVDNNHVNVKEIRFQLHDTTNPKDNSIEFQKRGAPHTHLIIWIKDFEQTVTNIDNVISAEIPSDENSSEFKLVKKMMIHGPCEKNCNLTCNINGKCKYHYPRAFAEETIIGENAFPTYRRRSPENGGNTCMKYMNGKQVLVDNRNVVPYNFYLLETFDGHVNIEYVASVKTIKYIIKYQMKDRIW